MSDEYKFGKTIAALGDASIPVSGLEFFEVIQAGESVKVQLADAWATWTAAQAVDDDYTWTDRNEARTVYVTTGASNVTITLPDSTETTLIAGDRFRVSKVDSGAGEVTLSRGGASDTIEGETSLALPSQYNYATVEWSGSFWNRVNFEIVEQGENSNGHYVVFSSGVQVCWGEARLPASIGNAALGGYRSTTYAASLPAAYASGTAYETIVSGVGSETFSVTNNASVQTATQFRPVFWAVTSQGAATRGIQFWAIGIAV